MFDCIVPLGLKGKQSIVTSNNDRLTRKQF